MFYFGSIDFCISFLGKGEDFLSLFLGERGDIDFCIYFGVFCISFLGKTFYIFEIAILGV